jgi:hypothetical protein
MEKCIHVMDFLLLMTLEIAIIIGVTVLLVAVIVNVIKDLKKK